MLASLRNIHTFVNMEGAWLFAERLHYVDWMEERAIMTLLTKGKAVSAVAKHRSRE